MDLGLRAQELGETDIAVVLFTLAGALTGDKMSLPMLSAMCQSFSLLEIDRLENLLNDTDENDEYKN